MSKTFRRNSIFCFLCGIIFYASACVNISAQTADNRTTINENFELNIVQERITETEYVRSTDVRLNEQTNNGLNLEVGVSVRAERINVLLRGINGRVNFRASLEAIKQRIEQRRQNSAPN